MGSQSAAASQKHQADWKRNGKSARRAGPLAWGVGIVVFSCALYFLSSERPAFVQSYVKASSRRPWPVSGINRRFGNRRLLTGVEECAGSMFALVETSRASHLGNSRVVSRIVDEKHGFEFKLYYATGREFIWGKKEFLHRTQSRKCALLAAKEVSSSVHKIQQSSAAIVPEPVWYEKVLPANLRLPRGNSLMRRSPRTSKDAEKNSAEETLFCKIYLDAPYAADSIGPNHPLKVHASTGTKPLMMEASVQAWQNLSESFYGGASHLDWGTGKSSHFACGLYSSLSAIDSSVQWCKVVSSEIPKSQRLCKKIQMRCVEVGKMGSFSVPIANVTDPMYFSKYLHAVDTFKAPYFDTVLVDGRYRVACAIKALQYMRYDSVLMMHDYTESRRKWYGKVLSHFDLVEVKGDLGFFVPKENLSIYDYNEYPSYMGVQ